MDKNRQAVFFTPKGKVMAGAPPRGWDFERTDGERETGCEAKVGVQAPEILADSPPPTPRWNHDRDIPWEVEAQVWDALDPG